MNVQQFIDQLSNVSLPNVFNPYSDLCSEHDHPESSAIRRSNLENYLDAAALCGVDSVWIGRDYGYRGGRRTGIALTDETHLTTLEKHFGIQGMSKATIGETIKERTASQVWNIISEVQANVFLWNVFPFHPYECGNPMSNRRHTVREFNYCRDLLICLLEWFKPKQIIALGADAHKAVLQLGFEVFRVRHPSYGGHIEFATAIRKLYS